MRLDTLELLATPQPSNLVAKIAGVCIGAACSPALAYAAYSLLDLTPRGPWGPWIVLIAASMGAAAGGVMMARALSPAEQDERDDDPLPVLKKVTPSFAEIRRQEESAHELMQRIDEVTAQLQEALDKLDRVSNRDPLTDLYNRRWLLEQAQDEVVRARRDHRPLSVAALDLDRFKCINERFGRPAGDAALAAAAETMRTMMRPSDLIGRTAGEEFCIVMPDTDEKTARRVIERLREAIELCDIPELRGRHLTVSCGVATLERIDSGFSMLLARADDRLQQAKREGCNLVVAAA